MVRSHTASEKKRDTPRARKGYNGIYNSAENRVLTAEKPCDDIKLKKSDTSPVSRADYGQY